MSNHTLPLRYLGIQVDPVRVLAGAELQARVDGEGVPAAAAVVSAPFRLYRRRHDLLSQTHYWTLFVAALLTQVTDADVWRIDHAQNNMGRAVVGAWGL